MKTMLMVAARLLTGSFTPFLAPFWGPEEHQTVAAWLGEESPEGAPLEGASLEGAPGDLAAAVDKFFGGGWEVRLLNSGRAALQLALEAMRLPPGSEILLPSFGCSGVIMPVLQAGLKPVLVDVDQHFNPRFESMLEADGPAVRAVIVTHLSGCWCRDAESIIEWARHRGLFVIEDCAQAFGLKRGVKPDGQLAGTLGDVGVFSSGTGKPLFGPGGGWVISRHPDLAPFLRSRLLTSEPREQVRARLTRFRDRYSVSNLRRGWRAFGEMASYRLPHCRPAAPSETAAEIFGFQMATMSDVEARLARLQMGKTDEILGRRRDWAGWWRLRLQRLGFEHLQLLPEEENIFSKMLLSFPGDWGRKESKALKQALWSHGAEVENSYTPLHLRPPFSGYRRASMPVTDSRWAGAFAVPVRPNLAEADLGRFQAALTDLALRVSFRAL